MITPGFMWKAFSRNKRIALRLVSHTDKFPKGRNARLRAATSRVISTRTLQPASSMPIRQGRSGFQISKQRSRLA